MQACEKTLNFIEESDVKREPSFFSAFSIKVSIGLYVLIQLTLLCLSNWEVHLFSDANGYYSNALSFISSQPYAVIERQPFFPLFLSLGLWIAGETGTWLCVIQQMILLFATAFLGSKISQFWIPKWRNGVFILILLNPIAILHAHILITETFYAFLFTLGFWLLLKGTYEKRPLFLYGFGSCLGLMSLVRPEAQFILYLTPVIVLFTHWCIHSFKKVSLSIVLSACLALGIGYAMTLPWQLYLSNQGKEGISSGQKKLDHLSWSVTILENIKQRGNDLHDLYQNQILPESEKALRAQPNYTTMTEAEKRSFLNLYYIKRLFSYPLKTIVKGFAQSWSVIFIGTGTQYLMLLLDLKESFPQDFQHQANMIGKILDHIKQYPLNFLLSFVLISISLVCRILGILGVFYLLQQKKYKQILLMASPVLLISLLFLFDGNSRVRLPLEPILMIWAAYGVIYLRKKRG